MKKNSLFSVLQKFRILLTRKDKKRWILMVVSSLFFSFLEIITAGLIAMFARVLTEPEIGGTLLKKIYEPFGVDYSATPNQAILGLSLSVGGIFFIKNTLGLMDTFWKHFSIQSMCCTFRERLLHNYTCIDYSVFLTHNSSFYANIVEHDTFIAFTSGLAAIAIIFSEGFVALGLFSVAIFLDPIVTCIICSITALLAKGISIWGLPQFSRWGERYQKEYQLSYQHVYEFFYAFKELILFGKRAHFINEHQKHSVIQGRMYALKTAGGDVPRFLIEMVFVGVFLLAVMIFFWKESTSSAIVMTLGGYLYIGFRLIPSANRIISQVTILEAAIPALERVYKEFQKKFTQENFCSCPEFAFNHCISVKGIHFQYLNTHKEALSDITLEIKKGETIGIVGATGSGKSTLIDLILGFLKPKIGEICVDEHFPVTTFEWHQCIGYVPQTPYLVDGTIAENIAFGCEHVDTLQLSKVIEQAQLRELVDSLPQKESTLVGERGVRLSGGERQRIAIARALYNNPGMLIFDEATSALDNETEARLIETIYTVSQGRTVIMIAHRVTTLKNCNRIVVMKQGKIEKIVQYKDLIQ
ncbi:MAG: ABC transporter ATP-binding protein/permease [Holosporales bacterium]|nr:ABC transporter ATP-binding protein/permease [Holosporales bacterium]